MTENSNTSVEASVLRCGYNIGFFDKADIEKWAGFQIAAVDAPSDALIELAILRHTHPLDVMKLLASLTQGMSLAEVVVTKIGFIGISFEDGRVTLESAIRGLFALVHESGVSSTDQGSIYWLDDAYDLALTGHFGSMEMVQAEFSEFVRPHAEQLRKRLVAFSFDAGKRS